MAMHKDIDNNFAVIIVGAGIVGLTLALLLAKQKIRVAVLESKKIINEYKAEYLDPRAYAISRASEIIFKKIGIWDQITDLRASVYRRMVVWDEMSNGRIEFTGKAIAQPNLGHILEHQVIVYALLTEVLENKNISLYSPATIKNLTVNDDHALVELENQLLKGQLLVAADGGNSFLRNYFNIAVNYRDYEQQAIVATVKTEKPHEKTAWQRFLTLGVLAFLPMNDAHACTIVWSTANEHALQLMQHTQEEFGNAVTQALNHQLGSVKLMSDRLSSPLKLLHVQSYILSRVALVGDAAHVVHPLAGQGINLGLLDAAALAQLLMEADSKNNDFGSCKLLRRYERWRKSENSFMMTGIDTLKILFSARSGAVQQLRGLGLTLTNQIGPIKNFFMARALGLIGDLPDIVKQN